MTDTNLNFDATQVDPTPKFQALPNDDYVAHIVDSEIKPTAAGTGRYLQLAYEVLSGQYAGRKFWVRLNIDNPNQTAKEIAQQQLSQICHATGVLRLTSSTQLHNKPHVVKLVVKQDAGREPTNEAKRFLPYTGPSVAAAAAPVAQAAAQSAAAVPAWAQK